MYNRVVHRGKGDAPWRAHLESEEKQRLEVIERRIELKNKALEELLSERHRIMRRAIARRRRQQG
ncbi:MAG: hypothetical protein GYB50_25330 [Rhodobacteraceae bacterium]|nr:hypothetical protein [Paracoccaceae bacterium]